ncbi:MAG: threonylcarbamoyl-AMP synthase [Hyphomicrobiales bacterium]|nr:MAG: threonylcarbamoyl-AMP synthase [Hyphomicrobiales bacterium]
MSQKPLGSSGIRDGDKEAQKRAQDLLRKGSLVGIPTETVYGLAADACNGQAVARIFEVKGRPQFNPLICHVDGLELAQKLGVFDERAMALAKKFWPGSLSIVVPKTADCPVSDLVSAGLDTIAIRCPNSAFTRDLIASMGMPLAAPSANPSGKLSPTVASAVRDAFSTDQVPLVVDMGPCKMGLESTIVYCVEGQPVTILRHGAVLMEDLEAVLGENTVRKHQPDINDENAPRAPGMLASHYAPDSKLVLWDEDQPQAQETDTVLTFAAQPVTGMERALNTLDLSLTGDMAEAAANLFSMLRQLDELQPKRIIVVPPPAHGLGVAIVDRLRRAAAPRNT